MDVFVSVGTGLSPAQDEFVRAVEARLSAAGLSPRALNRNEWSTLSPLHAVEELLDRCHGAVVIGLERYHFPAGVERRGADRESATGSISLPTPWNQIEAALAHGRGLPLFIILDETLKAEGLLEPAYGWFVVRLPLTPGALQTSSFTGQLEDWAKRVRAKKEAVRGRGRGGGFDPATLSVGELLLALRPAQIGALIGALAAALSAAFALGGGVKFHLDDRPQESSAEHSGARTVPKAPATVK